MKTLMRMVSSIVFLAGVASYSSKNIPEATLMMVGAIYIWLSSDFWEESKK